MQFRGLEQYVSGNAGRLGLADFGVTHFTRWRRRTTDSTFGMRQSRLGPGMPTYWSSSALFVEICAIYAPRDMIDIQSFIRVQGADE
jgi:hypothetical protein